MPILFKPINPDKLKVEAFREALKEAAKPYADGVKRDFEKTYATWSRKSQPALNVDINVNAEGGVSILVEPQGRIYEMVHEGTRPHVIRIRRAKVLAFRSPYAPKTVPGRIGSGEGGASGGIIYRRVVNHPGTKPRNFSKIIMQKWRKPFYDSMQRALERGADRSGHGM